MKGNSGVDLAISYILEDGHDDMIEIVMIILVLFGVDIEMYFEILFSIVIVKFIC